MSFSPFPVEFIDFLHDLQSLNSPRVLDLGSGQGDFSRLLQKFQLPVWGLDRMPKAAGVNAQLQGDALNPPIVPHSLDCILAGNLVRHLLVQEHSGAFLAQWLKLLRPGGAVFLFEDEPKRSSAAESNYLQLQSFLAQLMPSARGPLLSRQKFCEQIKRITPQQQWSTGMVVNEQEPDSAAVLSMLQGGRKNVPVSGPVSQLVAKIEKNGLSYGSYWWAQAKIL